ncbi:M56 family metallopeptidase [Rhodopirellula baltica]|uniref:Membrane protein containing Peptidase M56, BlaR1 domain protein n=1 Tax=Rhodopirellula baltica SWK14 TaxID=993516 RepID=L7CAT5_RHOBT|nr:M56 family metallopeptidase [Rhodopirellula baltica]ELP30752.1 membrane protein containing Peptidase M56, BlaR1 domain protein [Rhodopirellula baltica SWK14]
MESTWATQLGWVLLNSVWQFSIIAIGVTAIRSLLPVSPRQRHHLACWGMLAMGLCPMTTWFMLSRSADPATMMSNLPIRLSFETGWHLQVLIIGWLIGMAIFSIRPILGWWSQRKLLRDATGEIPDHLAISIERALNRVGVRRVVRFKLVSSHSSPMVTGWLRPIVLVPVSMLTTLSPQELDLLIVHELLHVRRHDCFVNAIQVLMETVFFYHPAVWWLSREIHVSREFCCDDSVSESREERLNYCRALLKLETSRPPKPAFTLAAQDGDLLRRIRRLSLEVEPSLSCSPVASLASGALVAAIAFVLLLAPTMVEHPASVAVAIEPPVAPPPEAVSVLESTEETEDAGTTVTYLEQERWKLKLDECISIAIQNRFEQNPDLTKLDDVSREVLVRNLARDIENAYWDLYAAHQVSAAILKGREEARLIAEDIEQRVERGICTLQELSQAEGFAKKLQTQLEESISGTNEAGSERAGLLGQEKMLRELMGVASSDDTVIDPIDDPMREPTQYEFAASVRKMMETIPELRNSRTRIEQQKAEVAAAKAELAKEFDAEVIERFLKPVGSGDALEQVKESHARSKSTIIDRENPKTPFRLRRELARIQNAAIRIARENSKLQEDERLLTSKLSEAIRKTNQQYQLYEANREQCVAIYNETSARTAQFAVGATPANVVLQCREKYVLCEIDFWRAIAEYNKAERYVSYLDGTLLDEVRSIWN